MRIFAAIFLLLFVCSAQQPNPDAHPAKTSVNKRDAQRETQNEEKRPQQGATERLRPVTIEQPNAEAKQANPYDARHDPLYRAYLWFTIFGVLVGLLGVGAIYWQTRATTEAARATARSAQAAEDSVALQQIAQKQWVNLEHWRAFKVPAADNRTVLRIDFQIVNPTHVPLTHHLTRMSVGGPQQTVSHVTLIAPSNPYIASIGIELEAEQKEFYERGAFVLQFECTVFFADAVGTHWQQDFVRMLAIGPKGIDMISDTKNILRESTVPPEANQS